MPAPRFVIVIGANGAGKSTWCRAHPEELPSNFYDADSIAQGLGSYNDPALQLEARALVDERIDRHLERNESFGFESTYSGASRPRIARHAHELGYATYAIFVGTRDPSINIDRVAARVRARTGHHVPESEIQRRWTAAQNNLIKTASVSTASGSSKIPTTTPGPSQTISAATSVRPPLRRHPGRHACPWP